MDLRWQEEQRAFQARVLIDEEPDLALRPYRTFVGSPGTHGSRTSGRGERLLVLFATGAVIVALLLALGVARELAALAASFTGGVALMVAVSPAQRRSRAGWTPLLAVYSPSVLRGAAPVCVTQISIDEFERLGEEGFGTVVGDPRPGATFGLFVDDHLVWPRTPPRRAAPDDPSFGTT